MRHWCNGACGSTRERVRFSRASEFFDGVADLDMHRAKVSQDMSTRDDSSLSENGQSPDDAGSNPVAIETPGCREKVRRKSTVADGTPRAGVTAGRDRQHFRSPRRVLRYRGIQIMGCSNRTHGGWKSSATGQFPHPPMVRREILRRVYVDTVPLKQVGEARSNGANNGRMRQRDRAFDGGERVNFPTPTHCYLSELVANAVPLPTVSGAVHGRGENPAFGRVRAPRVRVAW